MTSTENRLRDYLGAVADSVRTDNTRPLMPADGPRPVASDGRPGWRGWIVPLAAAASVLAIASLGVALTGHVTGHQPSRTEKEKRTGTTAPFPTYYVSAEGPINSDGQGVKSTQPVVRSVATGAVIARVPNQGKSDILNMAAAPDDRTFYVVYESLTTDNLTVCSFRVLGPGRTTKPAPIRGGVLNDHSLLYNPGFAVSPDGTKVAMTVNYGNRPYGHSPAKDEVGEIMIIDLRTGARQVWTGGLNRPGLMLEIGEPSWADNGRSLDFLASWFGIGTSSRDTTQVRSLSIGDDGPGLGSSTVLVRGLPGLSSAGPWMVAAAGDHIDVLVLPESATSPIGLAVIQYSAADGKRQRVLCRHGYRDLAGASLTVDPSGRYPLIGILTVPTPGHDAASAAWIDNGSLRTMTAHANPFSLYAW
jgi:hypothetical protein